MAHSTPPPQPPFAAVKEEAFIKSDADAFDTPTHAGSKRPRGASFGADPFSAEETRAIRARLDVGLSRNETQQRPGPGGTRLTYIEGWRVIHDANQIFGFNGWSSHIVSLDTRYLDENHGRFSACVSATVRITLRDGASREDRGGGIADNMRSRGDAILKAEKEAVTDATKRALKNFGLRLGLSLYDRQHVRDIQNNRVAPNNHQQQQQQQQQQHKPAYTHHPAHRAAAGPSTAQPAAATPPRAQPPQQQNQNQNQNQAQRPTTPGAAASPVPDAATAARIAANRERALQKQQALRRERELKVSASARPGLTCGVGGPVGSSRPATAGGPSAGARAAGAQAGAGNGAGGGSSSEDAKIAQREIDELSAMALAEF